MVLSRIAARLHLRNPRALSKLIMEMVADGDLPEGARMPTVRDTAAALGMSPASVAAAWRELVDWRVVETRRRGGTVVLGPPVAPRATRFDVMMRASRGIGVNLGNQTPDIAALPDLRRGLANVANVEGLHDPFPCPIAADLEAVMRTGWPFVPQMMMATHGGSDAVELALQTNVRPGDKVIVESPTASRVLDILDELGAQPISLPLGPDGPDLAALARALRQRPAAMLYQPFVQHPTGGRVSAAWLSSAAAMLAETRMPVIELVQTALLQPRPWPSLGDVLPQQVVHVQAFNFFFGSDMRIAVAGGSAYYIDRMWQKLTYSSGWVSRILQSTLAFQLSDPIAVADLKRFVALCRRRIDTMQRALVAEGLDVAQSGGPSLWVPVADEHVATMQLGSAGYVVHPGRYFSAVPLHQGRVLINGAIMDAGHAAFARLMADVAR